MKRSAAQALIWFAFAVPLFVSMAGLAIDSGLLVESRRELQSVTDGAARAGATRLDYAQLRDSAGQSVQLDVSVARQAAQTYVSEALSTTQRDWQGSPEVQVNVSPRRVSVVIRVRIKTAFLRVVSIDDVPVEASANADMQYGIHGSGGL
jgi:Flp pilus assembly protein TadG